MLLECKNYAQTVEQREIDKFMSDLMASKASIGLMISLKSNIRGKRRVDVHREKTKLVGFVVIGSEADLAGIGVVVRSMMATQCVFTQSNE